MTLITDKDFPTRRGNSTCRDTTPDLTFVKNVGEVKWVNTALDLGSDHYVIEVSFAIARFRTRKFKVVDWDVFRKVRAERAPTAGTDFEGWCKGIRDDAAAATKEIVTDLDVENMDSRLARLLEAKQALLTRWKGQKHNRRLRKKVSEVNRAIEEHCKTLCKQQWHELCESVESQLRSGKSWGLLKHLLDQGSSRSSQRRSLARVIHLATDSTPDEMVVNTLIDKYLPVADNSAPTQFPDYAGCDVPELDQDFSVAEIRQVLFSLNGKSVPGPDGVTNKMLKNLDDESIDFLTEKINEVWRRGQVPAQWKTAYTVLIPKPGKAPGIDNLRPISLTSCVGKVAEHALLNRLKVHLETNDMYTHNMIGFRAGLSTQDAMKLIKHQIIDRSTGDTRAILGLDLEKAFDNISHEFILQSIAGLGLGKRAYDFVRSFLSQRTAKLKIEGYLSQEFTLGSRGTPQGSVISPTLFNIAMIGLSKELAKIQRINHTIYADDITIWCAGGSEGQVEEAMQSAIDVTERFLRPTGLRCSSSKSELLLYKKRPRGGGHRNWKPASESEIRLFTGDGSPVPRVDSLRILGMYIESNGANGTALRHITAKTESALGLIRRIANRHRGIKEDNLIRIIHAFVLCHLSYSAAMHNWLVAERSKLNSLIRKVFKLALGLPVSTRTENLFKLGVHNTLEEIIEAQERSQLLRLSGTKAGREILEEMGLNSVDQCPDAVRIPRDIRSQLHIAPVPRNMHPAHNVGRRRARGRALLAHVRSEHTEASFVDAAAYVQQEAFAVSIVDSNSRLISSATVRTSKPVVAEQVAIALAMLDSRRESIYSDSKAAIKAYETGMVAPQALRILQSVKSITPHSIIWFPAHLGSTEGFTSNPNEGAHEAARGLTDRAASTVPLPHGEPLLTFNEITKHFYLSRRVFPLPHPALCRARAVTLRLLQARAYPNPAALHAIYPERYPSADCPACGLLATLDHVLWECEAIGSAFSEDRWAALLRSPELHDQTLAVQSARERAAKLGLAVPTWD